MTDRDFKADVFNKTSAAWTVENPFLAQNDIGVESDTGKIKVGVGLRWASTAYLPAADSPDVVRSQVAGITGADPVTNIVSLTQAEYNAIPTKSSTTFYVIVGESQ